jgi:hypothetical protein
MEKTGALKVGELVTDQTLERYGRNTFDLIGTNDPSIWLLDFRV